MGVSIGAQTISITAAALCGLLAGLLYELLRLVRRGGGRAAGVICDFVFCLFCMGALFAVGMLFCGGRLGFWESFGFLLTLGLYVFGISPPKTPVFGKYLEKRADFLKNRAKK